jgi:hypothetical protein
MARALAQVDESQTADGAYRVRLRANGAGKRAPRVRASPIPSLARRMVTGALFAQQALQQAEVGRVSETQPSELPEAEPLDGVVLLWLHVRDFSAPAA